jgi:hypothetical protein
LICSNIETGVPNGLFCEKSIIFQYFPGWLAGWQKKSNILFPNIHYKLCLGLHDIIFKIHSLQELITEISLKSTPKIGNPSKTAFHSCWQSSFLLATRF